MIPQILETVWELEEAFDGWVHWAKSPRHLQIRSARDWRAAAGREARRDSWLQPCVVRGGIVSAFVDALQSHLQIGRATSHSRTKAGCCHWVSWLMDGSTLLGGSNDNGAEEVRVGLWLSGGMKTALTVLCLVDQTTAFHLILLVIDWLWLVWGINGSKNWIHVLSPDLFWNVQRVYWVRFVQNVWSNNSYLTLQHKLLPW